MHICYLLWKRVTDQIKLRWTFSGAYSGHLLPYKFKSLVQPEMQFWHMNSNKRTQGLSMIEGQRQATSHNTPVTRITYMQQNESSPASEEGNKVTRSGLINQLIAQNPKVSSVWSQRHWELPTHLTRTKMRGGNTFKHPSPTDKVSTATHFHLVNSQ